MLKQLDTLIGFAVVMSVVSLLVTIITQMVSSVLGLRGKNLADALKAMMLKIDPQLVEHAGALADKILTQPVISDSMLSVSKKWPTAWKRASAIRPDELLGILKDIAGTTPCPTDTPTDVTQAAAKLLAALKTPTAETTTALNALTNALPALAAEKGAALIKEYTAAANVELGNLGKWFNSVEDRSQQWFAMHARVITIGASFAAAFILQLDSIELLKQVSSDSDLRAKLVAGATAIQKQADTVLHDTKADQIDRTMHKEVMGQISKQYAGISTNLFDHDSFASMDKAQEWLRSQLKDDPNRVSILNDYRQTVLLKKLGASEATLEKVVTDYQKTGLQLLPSPYPWPKPHWYCFFNGQWSWPLHHLVGILFSSALLSLGAPFWFNTLKSLTNLRPILANEVDKNPKQLPATASGTK